MLTFQAKMKLCIHKISKKKKEVTKSRLRGTETPSRESAEIWVPGELVKPGVLGGEATQDAKEKRRGHGGPPRVSDGSTKAEQLVAPKSEKLIRICRRFFILTSSQDHRRHPAGVLRIANWRKSVGVAYLSPSQRLSAPFPLSNPFPSASIYHKQCRPWLV